MKRVINYTTGGLGNRLRPLSSAYAIAQETGRIFSQYWDSETTNGSLAKFNELFDNKIDFLSSQDIENLNSYKIYSDYNIIKRLSSKYGLHTLKTMIDNGGVLSNRNSYAGDIIEDNIILYCNNYIPNTNVQFCHEFLQNLRPTITLQKQIDIESHTLGINKNIVGVHARGTDFNANIDYYTNQIYEYIKSHGNNIKFFLSTDDLNYDNIIKRTFGDKIISRNSRLHLTKTQKNKPWDYNFVISKEKSQDSIVDLFLLSQTNIQIYHPESTFAEIAIIMSNKI